MSSAAPGPRPFDMGRAPGRPGRVTDLAQLRMLSRIADQVGEGVAVVDNEAHIIYANPEFARMHRCTPEYLQSRDFRGSDFYAADEWDGPVQDLMRDALADGIGRAAVTRRRADGTTFAAHVTLSLLRDGADELVGRVLCVQDITDRCEAEASLLEANRRLELLARTDQLTGLPNRTVFNDRLDQALATAARDGRNVAVLFVDVDRFKNVNDSLGHHCGDEVLMEVSRRLVAAVRHSDTVARLGGDEFAVLLGTSVSPEEAAHSAERMVEALRPPFLTAAMEFFVGASIGVALWPEDCRSKTELLQHADAAMYRAKAAGGNRFEMFQPAMSVAAHERLSLEADLRRAVDGQEFFLRYHPQVDLASGVVTGVEALVRWVHPTEGELPPDRFISMAERTALIVPIGAWVLREACQQAMRWRDEIPTPLRMSVNVSPLQLVQPGFVAMVTGVLADTGLPASALELEITETALVADTGPAIDALKAMRSLGVALAIDDFGTGYSSLSSLRRFLVDRVKLDMSLISELGKGDDRAAIGNGALVAAAIDLAHALGLETVAEGIGDERQVETLARFGCEEGQGYFWAKPLLAAEIPAWIATRRIPV